MGGVFKSNVNRNASRPSGGGGRFAQNVFNRSEAGKEYNKQVALKNEAGEFLENNEFVDVDSYEKEYKKQKEGVRYYLQTPEELRKIRKKEIEEQKLILQSQIEKDKQKWAEYEANRIKRRSQDNWDDRNEDRFDEKMEYYQAKIREMEKGLSKVEQGYSAHDIKIYADDVGDYYRDSERARNRNKKFRKENPQLSETPKFSVVRIENGVPVEQQFLTKDMKMVRKVDLPDFMPYNMYNDTRFDGMNQFLPSVGVKDIPATTIIPSRLPPINYRDFGREGETYNAQMNAFSSYSEPSGQATAIFRPPTINEQRILDETNARDERINIGGHTVIKTLASPMGGGCYKKK